MTTYLCYESEGYEKYDNFTDVLCSFNNDDVDLESLVDQLNEYQEYFNFNLDHDLWRKGKYILTDGAKFSLKYVLNDLIDENYEQDLPESLDSSSDSEKIKAERFKLYKRVRNDCINAVLKLNELSGNSNEDNLKLLKEQKQKFKEKKLKEKEELDKQKNIEDEKASIAKLISDLKNKYDSLNK